MSAVKGWCPGAWTPMRSGDGLILRVRPPLGRITRDQALGLCAAARGLANGVIDLTNRANLQLRGVTDEGYQPLLEQLLDLGLLDADPATEARRNITVTPFARDGDLSLRLAQELTARLAELPALPAKFGFVVDCGDAPVLAGDPGDIRLERDSGGGVLVRADGADWGRAVTPDQAVDGAIDLARWFAERQSAEARRMRALADRLPEMWQQEMPAPPVVPPAPGVRAEGFLLGVAFGSMSGAALRGLLDQTGAEEVVITPWRMILLPGVRDARRPGFVSQPGSPLMAAHACPGAPACAAASVETRPLALALAGRVGGSLHVSGCAKGCALPRAADVTLVGRDGAFDLVRGGASWDVPARRGLAPDALLNGEPL
ncbi:MAG: precorrin-3B synthase [Pseudooceanicola sp.]|nr:precorrin-3B synthase [Pseudooceanicola sp.]